MNNTQKLYPERRLAGPLDNLGNAKWAVKNEANGFITSEVAKSPYSSFSDDINDALLYEDESAALAGLQRHAMTRGIWWARHHLVRVIETVTPVGQAPDIVTDVVTVL